MNPRRLIPYVVVFLILAGTYVGLRWHQAQKEAREQQAKQVFTFKDAEITTLTLKRGKEEVQLTRQGAIWEITSPLKAKADQTTVNNLVQALAKLKMERDLGPGDFKAFGLDQPWLLVSFTAEGKPYQLSLGQAAPGNRGFYVRKDEAPNILIIASDAKSSLDQQLTSLRDKTLWTFKSGEVKALQIRTDKTQVDLEKSGPQAWRWVGRPDFKVRADRVEELLRQFTEARITEFPSPPPKDLKAAGLAPKSKTEIVLTTPQETQTLFLGAKVGPGLYARHGADGPVVQVNQALSGQITQAVANLEDRRLFAGSIMEVEVAVWGTPGKFWTAIRDKSNNFWKVTGPDNVEIKQSVPKVELALLNFQKLEYSSLLPKAGAPGKEAFSFELFGRDGKQMLHLDELEIKGDTMAVLIKSGKTTFGAVVPRQKYDQWRAELGRLTTPPPQPAK